MLKKGGHDFEPPDGLVEAMESNKLKRQYLSRGGTTVGKTRGLIVVIAGLETRGKPSA